MKTLQELYSEVISSDTLKKEFTDAARNGNQLGFIRSHGVDASEDEIKAFFEELAKKDKELSATELENAAGGTCNKTTRQETVMSIFSLGIACAIIAEASAVNKDSHTGQQADDEGRLCSDYKVDDIVRGEY